MSQEGSKQLFWLDESIGSKVRYIKLEVIENNKGGYDGDMPTVCQLSEFKLLNSAGTAFYWPRATVCKYTCGNPDSPRNKTYSFNTQTTEWNEHPMLLLDGSTSTKWCNSPLPFVLEYDVGERNFIDLLEYHILQLWTANDTGTYDVRNPTTFSISISNDAVKWHVLINEVGCTEFPKKSNALGYQRDLLNL